MLGKTPVIGKLLNTENSGHRTFFSDEITSPKSPLDFKIRSPRGMKNCVVGGGGVGLGIVAALEKSGGGGGGEIPMRFIVGNLNLNRSSVPIPIGSNNKPSTQCREVVLEESESYTYVTCHGPNKSFTRVYCDGGECKDIDRDFDRKLRNLGVFYESPPRFTESKLEFPTSDFLSSCYLCRKKLHGKDIYMYRGEKAFCSAECRHRQIVNDERKEKCRSEASIYGDGISISPYSGGGQLFSTSIFAS
ncbi:Protein of unknown function DUF581 [Macleaya cordata]|uniref:FLZ-type domain-containing protein n=1 Tax=Macleaya cordata TaxID=56857 RepID=A0A200Q173_MACCD|nr:Protein of unknown function DUF581 [Macleaya cordata]